MFKWLANLIIKTPIQGTCSCCEAKKERLRQMQKVILNEENPNPEIDEASSCSGCCSCSKPEGLLEVPDTPDRYVCSALHRKKCHMNKTL